MIGNTDEARAIIEGMAAAERVQQANEVPDWMAGNRAEEIIKEVVAQKIEFTTDDLWERLEMEIAEGRIQEPDERRIMGAMMRRLQADGVIISTDFTKPSTRRHGAPLKVWRTDPSHAYDMWRAWGGLGPGSEQVQIAKTELDRTIRENEIRVNNAADELERIRKNLEKDRADSAELNRRGYNKKRLPSFEEVMAEGERAEKDRITGWIKNTTISPIDSQGYVHPVMGNVRYPQKRHPNARGSFESSLGPIITDASQVAIEYMRLNDENGNWLGDVEIAPKDKQGFVSVSQEDEIVGFQIVSLNKSSNVSEDRLIQVVKAKIEGMNLEFSPMNVTDNIISKERYGLQKAWGNVEDLQEGKNLVTLMENDMIGNDFAGWEIYKKNQKYNSWYGMLNALHGWMAYSPSQREWIASMEQKASDGDETAINMLEDIEFFIQENTDQNFHYWEQEYEGMVESAFEEAHKKGKITDDEFDAVKDAMEQMGMFVMEEGNHEWANSEGLKGMYNIESLAAKAGAPSWGSFVDWVQYKNNLEHRESLSEYLFDKGYSSVLPSTNSAQYRLFEGSQAKPQEERKKGFISYGQPPSMLDGKRFNPRKLPSAVRASAVRASAVRNINGSRFIGIAATNNKLYARNLAQKVRIGSGRNARVIPKSKGGFGIYVGPRKAPIQRRNF